MYISLFQVYVLKKKLIMLRVWVVIHFKLIFFVIIFDILYVFNLFLFFFFLIIYLQGVFCSVDLCSIYTCSYLFIFRKTLGIKQSIIRKCNFSPLSIYFCIIIIMCSHCYFCKYKVDKIMLKQQNECVDFFEIVKISPSQI